MILDISAIISTENKSIKEEVCIDFTSYDAGMGDFPVIEKSPFTLSVSNVENKRLRIEGETEVVIGMTCDRCLKDVPVKFGIEIFKEIDIAKFRAGDVEELEDTNYMIGTNLDVNQLIFGEILVSWPMKVLCKEDCAGICKRCGINLNLATCQCQKTEPDPRMAAIQDIFNQFKEV